MKENSVGKVLKVIGWMTLILGIIIGLTFLQDEFGVFWGIVFIMVEVIAGIFILGFAEIIKLLNEINIRLDYIGNKNYDKIHEKIDNESQLNNAECNGWVLTIEEIEKVKNYYKKKKMNVEKIISTPFDYYCLAKLENKYELIELGGFNPIIVGTGRLNALPEIKKWLEEEGYKNTPEK